LFRAFFVYILTSHRNGKLYIGYSDDIFRLSASSGTKRASLASAPGPVAPEEESGAEPGSSN